MNIPTPSAPLVVTTVALLLAATVADVRSRRIPNFLTFPAVAAGIAIRGWADGWTGLLIAVAGAVCAPAVLMAVRAFRRLGMGDIKLAAAVGALLGPAAGALAMLVSAVAGGFLALAVMLRPGTAGARLLSPFFVGIPVLQRIYADTEASGAPEAAVLTIPYGVAISIGSLLTLGGLRWS